jgi:transcriptional regulator with XRE-family HTH domain
MSTKIANQLRLYRRRSAFTQKELAFLLGYRTASIVLRFERQQRRITLAVAFAYQIIFDAELHETFPALYTRVEEGVTRRLHELYERLKEAKPSRKTALKLEMIRAALNRTPAL